MSGHRRHRQSMARTEQLSHFAGRLRSAEKIALHLRAAERAQHLALRLGLDALSSRGHVAGGGDVHHGLHDHGRAPRLRDISDEAAGDLYLVEREALEIADLDVAASENV